MWSSFKRLGILSSTISYLSFGCWELLEDDNPHGAISRVLEKARKMAAENQYGPAIGSGRRFKQNGGVSKNIKVDLISTPMEKPRRLDFSNRFIAERESDWQVVF